MMPGNGLPLFLVLILSLSGTLYSQSTDDEMQQRIRETIRVLNESLVRRDRLGELEREQGESDQLHQLRLDLAEQFAALESAKREFTEERLNFIEGEKVPALERWGLAWRDAYQAAQKPKRKAFCLWICKRSRKLPAPPVGTEMPG